MASTKIIVVTVQNDIASTFTFESSKEKIINTRERNYIKTNIVNIILKIKPNA